MKGLKKNEEKGGEGRTKEKRMKDEKIEKRQKVENSVKNSQ